MMFPGSGTGAWEAAITNTLSPGDKVLMAGTASSPPSGPRWPSGWGWMSK